MIITRRSFLLTGAVSSAVIAAPAIVRASEKTTVTISQAAPTYQAVLSGLTTEFEKENASMSVKFVADGDSWDPLLNNTIRASMINSLPDASWQALSYTGILASRHIAQPLNKLFANDLGSLEALGISKAMIDATTVNDEVYSIPYGTTIPIIYCNMNLLRKVGYSMQQPPASWDEIHDIGLKIKTLDGAVNGGFIEYMANNAWIFQTLLASYGGRMMNSARTSIAFDGREGLQALNTLSRFGGIVRTDMSTEQARQAFKAGLTAMHIQSASGTTSIAKAVNGNFELAVGQIPVAVPEGRLAGAGHGFVMFTKDAAKQKVIWEFMKFAVGKKGQMILAKNSGYIPISLVALKDPAFLDEYLKINPLHRGIVERLAITGDQFSFSSDNTVMIAKMMSDEMREVIFQRKAPATALQAMATETKKLLG
ncbi:extracellular solute-binding protein [Mesorhizobium sp. B4-1-4]|uniref:extracellular solute-binding protein n=1 Tax=Mesorhizobium sp. B4-1-4 TaxID=2589888 RepID=UPI001129DFFB|nr:extracellular solute-binding protein [Mesorhizobium sp. B4-1-4]UCI32067.1 extracellular solute-binding protein [Mesorhizobium sp. B4-1-4]